MASKSSERGNDFNERLSKLEDKLKKFEYALTYYKLKSNDAPLLITGSADYTIKLWDLDKVSKFYDII
jgi:WD40 repeat protein